jgi:hypothetical protein
MGFNSGFKGLRSLFIFGNKKKIAGCQVRGVRGCKAVVMPFFLRNCPTLNAVWAGARNEFCSNSFHVKFFCSNSLT